MKRPPASWLIALGAAQAIALTVLLAIPLPNLGNVGAAFRRGLFLMSSIPGMVPGVPFSQTLTGQALGNLSQVQNLPQRLPLVLAALLIGLASTALGLVALRLLRLSSALTVSERLSLSYGLGTSLLAVLTLALGRFGLLSPWPIRAGLVLLAALTLPLLRPCPTPRFPSTRHLLLSLPFALILSLTFLGALQPTIEFDALEYHLQGPREWFEAGRMQFLPHNVYTAMPFGVEMLHLLGMVVTGDPFDGALVGQFLIALFAPATALLLARVAASLGTPRAGYLAAVLYLTTPWVYRLAVFPFVEGPLCFFHAALVFSAFRFLAPAAEAERSREMGLAAERSPTVLRASPPLAGWLLLGLLSGAAMSCKYPGLISAVIPFGLLSLLAAFRRSAPLVPVCFALGVLIVIGPWLARNAWDTGNPVYPLGWSVLGGHPWDAARESQWQAVHGPRPFSFSALVAGLADVAGRSDWQSPLYVLLAPLSLFLVRTVRGPGWLWAYVAYLFVAWFLLTHRLDRFWLPLLPPLVVLAGLGACWPDPQPRSWRAWTVFLLVLGTWSNLALISTPLCGPTDWTADLRLLRRDALATSSPSLASLAARLPADARPLLVGPAGVFHFRSPFLYNTVFDPDILETLARDRTPAQLREAFHQLGVTHVYVDWAEIDRHRKPGGYGFTPFITPELFDRLVASGVLSGPERIDSNHWLFAVRPR